MHRSDRIQEACQKHSCGASIKEPGPGVIV